MVVGGSSCWIATLRSIEEDEREEMTVQTLQSSPVHCAVYTVRDFECMVRAELGFVVYETLCENSLKRERKSERESERERERS
jgi:hypothetical protein